MSGRLAVAFKESLISTLSLRRVIRPPVTAWADAAIGEGTLQRKTEGFISSWRQMRTSVQFP